MPEVICASFRYGREVKVGRADELLEFFEFDEAVVEDDVLLDLVLLGQPFQAEPVGFALLAHQVGMGGAQHDVNHVGKLRQDLRQRLEHVLDSLVRREQAEGEQHHPAFHAELVLVEVRIHERDVGMPCGMRSILAGGAW